MKKIIILGTGRTASKFYKEVLKKDKDVYILHEVMFDFRFKVDINSIFKKHNVYNDNVNLRKAFDEIYSKPFFLNFKTEFPDKDELIKEFEKLDRINWANALNLIIELKAKSLNKKITGAKNPVHYSYASRVIKKLDDVKLIYLMRDPRSLYASEIPMKFKDSKLSQFPRMKSKVLQRILIFGYTNIEWIWAMITYKRIRKKALLCKYEDLISNYEGTFQRVFDFCELPFDKSYLDGIGVINSSFIENNSTGVSKHGLDKWKDMLNGFEKAWFGMLIFLFKY